MSLVDQGADQDADIKFWKRDDNGGNSENPEDGIERIAKSILDRTPWGQLTPEQAYAAALDTPEGRDLYRQHREARIPGYVDD